MIQEKRKIGRPRAVYGDTKLCPRCNLEKPITDFGLNKKANKPKCYCRKCDCDIQREFQSRPENIIKRRERLRRRYHEYIKLGKCNDCGGEVFGRSACPHCAEKRSKRELDRRAEQRSGKLCPSCEVNPLLYNRKLCDECSNTKGARFGTYQRKWRDQQKRIVMEQYGGAFCACCGESHLDMLTIDHINNNGSEHRKETGTIRIYRWLKKNNYPSGFQVLCFNCNCGRQVAGGICPHKKGVSPSL